MMPMTPWMTPSEIKKELIHTAQQLDAMRGEIMASNSLSRNDPERLAEVEKALAAAEDSCRKCALMAGVLVTAGPMQATSASDHER